MCIRDSQPAVAAGLGDLGGGNHVAGADLVGEALAFGVDQNRTCLLYTSRCV